MNQTSSDHLSHLAFLTGLGPAIKLPELIQSLQQRHTGITAFSKLPKRRTGYTFIAFEDEDSLNNFIAVKDFKFKGRTLSIKPYLTGDKLESFKEDLNKRRLFVNLIPLEWEDADLNSYFSTFGEMESAFIIKDRKTKISKGFGYVITKELSLANKLAETNSFDLPDGTHLVAWKHKVRKNKGADLKKKSAPSKKRGVEPKITDFIFVQRYNSSSILKHSDSDSTNGGSAQPNQFKSELLNNPI